MTRQNRILLALSILRLTRVPNLFIIGLTQYVTAIFLVKDRSQWIEVVFDVRFFLLVISTLMIAGAGYIINDYYDTKVDYVNRPKRVIVGRVIDRRHVLLFYFFLNGLAVLIGLLVQLEVLIFHLTSSFLLWVHSNHMKRLPLLGNFIIGLLSGASLLIVAIFFGQIDKLVIAYAFFAAIINVIREIVKDLEAIKGEEKYGSHALPSLWGIRNTKKLIYALVGFSVIALTIFLIQIKNPIATTYFLMLIPIFVYFLYSLVRADTQQRFAYLGDFANLIMLTGIISITFF